MIENYKSLNGVAVLLSRKTGIQYYLLPVKKVCNEYNICGSIFNSFSM